MWCPIKLFLSLCDLFLAHYWHFETNICIKIDFNWIVCFVWSVHSPYMNPKHRYESDFENNFSFNYFPNLFPPLQSKTIFLNYFLRLWEVSALVLYTNGFIKAVSLIDKHRKNCKCCPSHYLIVNPYSSMSWFKFRNLSVIVNCVTKSLIH